MIPAWLLVKWAKEPHDFDAHRIEEFGLGAIYGGLWVWSTL